MTTDEKADQRRHRGAVHTKPPRGVLLDIDGTLLDSNEQHARAWVEALRDHDVLVTAPEIRRLIGQGGDKILPRVGVDEDSDRGHAITARRKVLFRERYLRTCRPFAGARDLVARMREDGLVIAVATSSEKDDLAALLHVAGVHDLIDDAATSSDAERSKPDPDIVVAAMRRTEREPELLVMLGDTPYDIEAAARAGIRAVGVRCGGWSDAELGGAVATYEGPSELLALYDASPFGRARQDASARGLRRARLSDREARGAPETGDNPRRYTSAKDSTGWGDLPGPT
jgi:phosphoglycolate phosphatase-like HAD superfamily hydrolase